MSAFAELAIELRRQINANGGKPLASWVLSEERYRRIMDDPDYAICAQAVGERPGYFMGVRLIPV